MDIPVAAWSTDTAGTLPAAMWVGKTLMARQLRDAYAADKQATVDVVLRVISGVHELATGGGKPVWGCSDDECCQAIDQLRVGLDVPPVAEGPRGNLLLNLILSELLRRLLELIQEA